MIYQHPNDQYWNLENNRPVPDVIHSEGTILNDIYENTFSFFFKLGHLKAQFSEIGEFALLKFGVSAS